MGISSRSSRCRGASGRFVELDYFYFIFKVKCRIVSQMKYHSSSFMSLTPQSSDVWIFLSGPAGRLLESGKQLNTQAEPIHCTELHWSVTAAEGGEETKGPALPTTTISSPLHSGKETTFSSGTNAEPTKGTILLGTDAFKVTWE